MLGLDFHSLVTAEDLSCNMIDVYGVCGFGCPLPKYKEEYSKGVNQCGSEDLFLLPLGVPSLFAGQPVALLLAKSDSPRLVEMAAKETALALEWRRSGQVDIGNLTDGTEITDTFNCHKGKESVESFMSEAKQKDKKLHISGKFQKKSQAHFYIEGQSVIAAPDECGITCHVAAQFPESCQRAVAHVTDLPQSAVNIKVRRVGGGFGGKIFKPPFFTALAAQVAMKAQKPVRLVLPRETDMQLTGGRQEMEASWEVALENDKGKISALSYVIWMAHGASRDVQRFNAHLIGSGIDVNYAIPNWHVCFHFVKQSVAGRSACRAPGHYEAVLLMEAVIEGVAAELKISPYIVREENFFQNCGTVGLTGGVKIPHKLEDYSNLSLWERMKKDTFNKDSQEAQEFNQKNRWKKKGVSIVPARFEVDCRPGNLARVDVFRDGSVQVTVSGTEIGQGLHTKVGQGITTRFHELLGCCPPLNVISYTDTSTELLPNGPLTGNSSTSEMNMYAAVLAVNQLAQRLKPFVSQARKTADSDWEKPGGLWFESVQCCFENMYMSVLQCPLHLSATGMYLPEIQDRSYETFGVASSSVELDVLTGEARVLKTHIMFDIGKSANPMIDCGQVEGAFVMGMGHVLQEGMDFDTKTGKCLTENTWSYKPPIASDIPESFTVELIDLTNDRKNDTCHKGLASCVSGILVCFGLLGTRVRVPRIYKSAKATGEPPLLLSQAVHSAHLQAIMEARDYRPLPDNSFPIPAKPFVTLPFLDGVIPGRVMADNAVIL